MSPNPNHRAEYDENGDIILPLVKNEIEKLDAEPETRDVRHKTQDTRPREATMPKIKVPKIEPIWEEIIEEEIKMEEATPIAEIRTAPKQTSHVWRELRGKMYDVTSGVLSEGARQYGASWHDSRSMLRRIGDSGHTGMQRTWKFLTQPVWVPGRKNKPKQYSRGTLFVLDIVRFGGTFAFLFTALFVSLNYQSFWQIVIAKIDPLHDQNLSQELQAETSGTLADKLKRVPSLSVAGRYEGDLLSMLPPVGPPMPTLIIPKLGLNVPIVLPPTDALIAEDWKKLEEDIQTALHNGVVHYPGTARPGQAGNFFITGHSSYFPWDPGRFKSVFARLADLQKGDEYWVFYGGDKYRYVINDIREVRPSDVTVLDQPMNKRLGTLMTCTPVGTTLRRLILEAQEVDPATGAPLKVGEHGKNSEAPKVKVEMLPI